MSNLFDYLTWRRDIRFCADSCRAVDTLLFSCLSYLRFQPVFEKHHRITIQDAAFMVSRIDTKELHYRVEEDVMLLLEMAKGERYANVLLCDYVDHLDSSMEKQFSAITCLLDEDTMLIAFRGTDNTLIGWKEDFNMAFMDTVPSQIEAVQYLETMAIAYPNRCIVVTGHSKGGNLAVYASAFCSPQIQERIQHVYNHDGPGFSAKILQTPGYQAITKRVETFVPQSSIVGMLMEHEEHYTVVSSTQVALWQHDPYSWQILGPDFVTLDGVDKQSIIFDAAIKNWIAELEPSQREAFIEAIFLILNTTNATSFKELNENRMHNAALIVKAINSTDKQTKAMLSEITHKLLTSAKQAIETNRSEKPMDS